MKWNNTAFLLCLCSCFPRGSPCVIRNNQRERERVFVTIIPATRGQKETDTFRAAENHKSETRHHREHTSRAFAPCSMAWNRNCWFSCRDQRYGTFQGKGRGDDEEDGQKAEE